MARNDSLVEIIIVLYASIGKLSDAGSGSSTVQMCCAAITN